jgi:3'(2'), 5'-bisphosphate nucleotidase
MGFNTKIKDDMNSHLETAVTAALKAGEAIMNVYNTAFDVEIKEDNSPLTEADKKANEIINSFLEVTNIPIISEENKQLDYKTRKAWDICWVVDPVDGTKEFIKRNGEFTVNIALVENKKPILGVIYVPDSKVLYAADVNNKKAYKTSLTDHNTSFENLSKSWKPLQAKKGTDQVIKVVGSRSHMNQETLDFVAALKDKGHEVDILSRGSSLKFCIVAEGKADFYPRFAPTMEWDTAAGQAICNAVGIQVISEETKQPLLYNKENLLNPWFLVKK